MFIESLALWLDFCQPGQFSPLVEPLASIASGQVFGDSVPISGKKYCPVPAEFLIFSRRLTPASTLSLRGSHPYWQLPYFSSRSHDHHSPKTLCPQLLLTSIYCSQITLPPHACFHCTVKASTATLHSPNPSLRSVLCNPSPHCHQQDLYKKQI